MVEVSKRNCIAANCNNQDLTGFFLYLCQLTFFRLICLFKSKKRLSKLSWKLQIFVTLNNSFVEMTKKSSNNDRKGFPGSLSSNNQEPRRQTFWHSLHRSIKILLSLVRTLTITYDITAKSTKTQPLQHVDIIAVQRKIKQKFHLYVSYFMFRIHNYSPVHVQSCKDLLLPFLFLVFAA